MRRDVTFKMTAEDGERGQQRRAMEDCSTDERLQQETLSPTDVDQFMLGPNELTFFSPNRGSRVTPCNPLTDNKLQIAIQEAQLLL